MENTTNRAIAIVGAGAILPDAANVSEFWENVKNGRYSISEVRPERWDPALYYDPDHSAPDKTYSKIGGWVRNYVWDPVKWRLPIPPRVVAEMDESQKWAIACTRQALEDYGYPKRALNTDRTAVILGNAIGGEKHYFTVTRILFPEFARELAESASFAALPEAVRHDITDQFHERMGNLFPEITEDTMPGELSNCIAGRIANVFNFHGPNFVCDAACASAMAAISAATEGLVQHHFDVAVAGGLDRNMGVSSFVKFCKIGALSASGTRPYAEGADGFVMGEGAAIFLLKRLADAEHDGDKIYAVLRGIGGSSDGKGKGITAPNPVGQKFAIERAWENAGLSPGTVTLIEGHGTSTAVGDVVEAQSMIDVLASSHLPAHSVALGSVKSNFGHLKGAAGAAGLLKASLALRDKVLPPSVHCEHLNPNIDFAHSPLYVNTELKPWTMPPDGVRRAGLSAFGFGGTNFHAVLEEYIPGKLNGNGKRSVAVADIPSTVKELTPTPVTMRNVETASLAPSSVTASSITASSPSYKATSYKAPLRGALVIGAASEAALVERLRVVEKNAKAGQAPAPSAPAESDLRAPERLAIDYANAAELAAKATAALKALASNQPAMWKALRAQGIFRGNGPAPKVAFLYTGQGSQYVNMLNPIRTAEPIVAEVFAEADRVMTPVLGKPLTEFIYVDPNDPQAVAKADEDLRQTEITQPTVMAIDTAMTKLLEAYGVTPDFTMGHSVGEYGALIASGALPFADALEAVSARGRGMTQVAVNDKGLMAAVFAPLEEVERTLKTIDGYAVIANINSEHQTVIGGATDAVKRAIETFQKAGYEVAVLPVSHAFHTSIVAGASKPLRASLERLHLESPRIPIVANVTGEFYPTGPNVVPQMLDMLSTQVAAPVQFVKGLRTLYAAGARVFVEVGPKKALQGFAEDVLGPKGDVVSLFTNHPKTGDIPSFNQALCGLYASGLGRGISETVTEPVVSPVTVASSPTETSKPIPVEASPTDPAKKNGRSTSEPVVITGAALGLPGTEHIFDDGNVGRILRGEQFIDLIPARFRQAMLDKHITRLVKSEAGEPRFETLTDVADVIKLAGRGGAFDLEKEYGLSAERVGAFDRVTQLAIAAGIDALHDAGIPLVMRYKTTTRGTQLPERWGLPDSMRDDTGVIFASAFPGYDSFADEMARYYADHERREQLATLESVLARAVQGNGHSNLVQEIKQRISEVRAAIDKEPYVFNRRFLLRVLPMGHSQFAEFIGARGPNTQINAACASNTQGIGLAQDWIRAGRCNRVIIISADDITTDHLIDWMGAGFLATGAAATDEVVTDAAIPFDRRRHGMLIGMGAAGLVVESAAAARERGIQPICEVLSTTTNNSAFHATRLDVQHIGQVMETLVSQAEAQSGNSRRQIAPQTVFVSHETYTPARGGSASAEIHALRKVFGDVADRIVIANTKGFTGHAMGTGIEDVVAVKALETGCVPPVANFKEVDPELGPLNLSKGGNYPVEYAIHLGAGFGSQISMMLLHWIKTKDGIRRSPNALGYDYRIVDERAWSTWLSGIAGHPDADLEVVHRTLRVQDRTAAARITEIARQSQTAAATTTAPSRTPQAPLPTPVVTTKPAPPSLIAAAQPASKVQPATAAPLPTPPAPPKPAAKVDAKLAANFDAKTDPKTDAVKARVLALVSEKTGYPGDMLDLDLDLEADLGVDTVKQAEVFAAIREIYNIPRDENRKLRDYPTLAHVIRFVYEKRPDLAAAPAVAKEEVKPTTAKVAVVAEKRAPAPSVQVATGDAVKQRILALVVEKTGYPRDMLDLDLDLEADLGVDTVKQAEMFAAIRAAYDIPRDDNLKLRDYPTLARVIQFVYEKRPDLATLAAPQQEAAKTTMPASPAATAKQAPAAPSPLVATGDAVKQRILALVVEKTGYPQDMLDLDLDLEADLGVDTVKQAEMFAAIRAAYDIPRDENLKLRDYPTLARVIQFVYEKRPDLAATPTAAKEKEEVRPATPAAPAVAEKPAPTSTSPQVVAGDDVKQRILALVVEKTGYPKDMLDLDLDLEADLGVDTVKQAEMFAAIRAAYDIPRDENLKLRDYPTLARVIQFVYEKRPDLAATLAPAKQEVKVSTSATAAVAEKGVAAATPAQPFAGDDVRERILALVVEKTGYPKDMLDLDLDLEADLGVDTVKQAEMFAAIRAAYDIPRDENLKLRDYPTLARVIQFVYEKRPDLAATPATAKQEVKVTTETHEMAQKPAPAAPSAQAFHGDDVKERILALVVEKTGYPKDMLDLDLDLEADLGVDTVKQAEMFAAIRAAYDIPRDENLKLRDYPTLARVIQFVYEKRPDLAGQPATPPPPATSEPSVSAPVAAQAATDDAIRQKVLEIVAEKTGYPQDMLDLDLDLEADLGVDTVKQAEMFAAVRAAYNIPRDENLKLRDFPTLASVIKFARDRQPGLAAAAPPSPPPTGQFPAAAPTAAAQPASDESIKQKVLEIVAEKTGYPQDMLDLDLDLEADLGVDTVKQAEMFAAVRAAYNIPRDENLKLRDFPTLASVIRFARDRQPGLVRAPVASSSTTQVKSESAQGKSAAPASSGSKAITTPRALPASFDATNLIPRRVPVASLRPPLALCKPTGVTLASGRRVVIMPDKSGVADVLAQRLETLGVEVLRINLRTNETLDIEALENCLKSWLAAGPVHGVYWLPALDNEGPLSALNLATWHEALRVRVKSLYATMRVLYEQVAARGTFLVSATRLGGQHGYDEAGATMPLGGAVVGFTKTYNRERLEALAKAVDFEGERKPAEIADILIEETLRDPGAVELGYKGGLRWTVGLQEQPATDGKLGLKLDSNTVFLVTGAAGSIVSGITSDLATASGGTFYLLDLVPEPDPENPDLKRFVTDKDGLKRDLFARIQARGERATPALVEKELAGLERAQAANSAIAAVRAAGGTAHYFSVNLTDAHSVARVIKQVRERSGRIDVLLHAAGTERSHFLPGKTQAEFDLVFDVKSDGWFNLLHAIGDMPLGATVAFSSIAARFGNAGQTDYSSANDLLCKITSSFRTTRPATRGIVIDWSAWGGIGMATRGSIPKMMELAGIDMLPPEAGIPLIRRELTAGGTRGEIVVGQRLGILLNEWDVNGGLDTSAFESSKRSGKQGPMIGHVAGVNIQSGATIETALDPVIQPFLYDHQIDGTPVLPGVMGLEAFAEAALCLLPGWHVAAVEDVNFLSPFKFYRNKPRSLTIEAAVHPQNGGLLADCRLIGSRPLPNQAEPQVTTHFTALVRLTKQMPSVMTLPALGVPQGHIVEAADIYRLYFHGPAYQVLERAWWDGHRIVGLLAKGLPPNHLPSELPTTLAPRLIELCFQTAGVWEMGVQGRMGLPLHINQISSLGAAPASDDTRLYAVVTPDQDHGSFDAEVVDTKGNCYLHLSGYRTAVFPGAVEAGPLQVLQTAMSLEEVAV